MNSVFWSRPYSWKARTRVLLRLAAWRREISSEADMSTPVATSQSGSAGFDGRARSRRLRRACQWPIGHATTQNERAMCRGVWSAGPHGVAVRKNCLIGEPEPQPASLNLGQARRADSRGVRSRNQHELAELV